MRRFLSVAAVLGSIGAMLSGPAVASCVMPPSLPEHIGWADAVFVGRVDGIDDEGRTASVVVEEVWKGEPAGREVVVHGGPDDPNMASSVDRTYTLGQRYLFAVTVSEGRLQDNSCSATQEWSAELDELRPAGAIVVSEEASGSAEEAGAGAPFPIVPTAIGVTVLLLIGLSVLAFRGRP